MVWWCLLWARKEEPRLLYIQSREGRDGHQWLEWPDPVAASSRGRKVPDTWR